MPALLQDAKNPAEGERIDWSVEPGKHKVGLLELLQDRIKSPEEIIRKLLIFLQFFRQGESVDEILRRASVLAPSRARSNQGAPEQKSQREDGEMRKAHQVVPSQVPDHRQSVWVSGSFLKQQLLQKLIGMRIAA